MTNEITLQQKCIVMRNGIEIWTDSKKAERFEQDWVHGLKGAVTFEGRTLNTADILGVFLPDDMEDLIRRKNKQWKCKHGEWHDIGEKCQCLSREEKDYSQKRKEAIEKCGKCQNGWIQGENGMKPCDCIKNIPKP